MYERFPNWMSRVSAGGAGSRVTDRWQAVEKAAGAVTKQQSVDLVSHAFGYAETMTDLLRQRAREVDASYVTENDDLELQILAAGVVAALLTGKSTNRGATALAVLSTTFGRNIPDFMCKDLVALAAQQLQSVAEENRAQPSVNQWNTAALVESLSKGIPSPPETAMSGAAVLAAMTSVVDGVKGHTAKLADAIKRFGTLQKESADLAFQVVSGYSQTAEGLISDLAQGDAGYALAEDLYDTTQIMPALPSFEGIVRALVRPMKPITKKSTTLEALGKGVSETVLDRCLQSGDVSAMAMPLQVLLKKKRENGPDGWIQAFQQATQLRVDQPVIVEDVIKQIYIERCLMWNLGAA